MTHTNFYDQKERGDSETDPRKERKIDTSVHVIYANNTTQSELTALKHGDRHIVGVTGAHLNCLAFQGPNDHVHVYEGSSVCMLSLIGGEHEIDFGGHVANLAVAGGAVVHVRGHVGRLDAGAYSQVFIYRSAYVDQLQVAEEAFVRAENFATIFYANVREGGRFLMEKYVQLKTATDETRKRIIPYMSDPAEPRVHVVMTFTTEADAIECCKELTLEYQETNMLRFDGLIISHLTRCRCLDEYVEDKEGRTMVEFYADGISGLVPGGKCKLQKRFPKAQATVEIDGQSELQWMQEHQDAIDDLPKPESREVVSTIKACDSGCHSNN